MEKRNYAIELDYTNHSYIPNICISSNGMSSSNDNFTYSYNEQSNMTFIKIPTNNPKLITAAMEICKEIEEKMFDLDNLIQGIVELNSNPNIHM